MCLCLDRLGEAFQNSKFFYEFESTTCYDGKPRVPTREDFYGYASDGRQKRPYEDYDTNTEPSQFSYDAQEDSRRRDYSNRPRPVSRYEDSPRFGPGGNFLVHICILH